MTEIKIEKNSYLQENVVLNFKNEIEKGMVR